MEPILKSLQIYEAKNVLCAYNPEDDSKPVYCGIASNTAERHYIIPTLIAVGLFEDGSVEAGGLFDWNHLNETDVEDIFVYRYFVYSVNLDLARAFVRAFVSDDGYTEKESKAQVLEDCELSKVHITEEAKTYLTDL